MSQTLDAIHPWDRRPKETPKAFAAFVAYRDLGPSRSIRDLAAREPSANLRQMFTWSRTYDWVDRAASWDDHIDRENQYIQLEEAAEMRRRHIRLGTDIVQVALDRIGHINVEKLSVRDLCMLADLGVKIERQARGEATAKIDLDATPKIEEGPSGADILAAIRSNPTVLALAEELDRVMYTQQETTE